MSKAVSFAKKIRRSSTFISTVAMPKRLVVSARQRANKGIFSIEIEANSGFFSVMQTILFILVFCEEKNLHPDISARGGIYGDRLGTVDWFGRLFESLKSPEASLVQRLNNRTDIHTSRIKGVEELGLRARYEMSLTLAEASAVFNSHYRPRADVLTEVDSICNRLRVSPQTLAVHYRGTDKIHEAARVPLHVMLEAVEKIAFERPFLTNILLASDESAFIESFQRHPFKIPVSIVPAAYMPRGQTPVHFSGHPGLAIGREALLTCLILSRCGFLIKTASFLSAWAKVFNPSLPTWLIAPQFGRRYFPDRALWLDQESGHHVVPGTPK
jgi:hypothetical protein